MRTRRNAYSPPGRGRGWVGSWKALLRPSVCIGTTNPLILVLVLEDNHPIDHEEEDDEETTVHGEREPIAHPATDCLRSVLFALPCPAAA